MAVDVFRHRMNDNVRTMIERVLYIRAKKRIIDYHHDAMTMCYGRNCPNVDQTQRWIAGTFDPYQFGLVWPDKFGNVDFNAGRKGDLDAVCCRDFGEVAMRTTVDIGH